MFGNVVPLAMFFPTEVFLGVQSQRHDSSMFATVALQGDCPMPPLRTGFRPASAGLCHTIKYQSGPQLSQPDPWISALCPFLYYGIPGMEVASQVAQALHLPVQALVP